MFDKHVKPANYLPVWMTAGSSLRQTFLQTVCMHARTRLGADKK